MRILFLGLNYAPEEIGIAVYSSGLCEALTASGHDVRAVVAKPYYPDWRVFDGYEGLWKRTCENGVDLTRCPIYVPSVPTGSKRLVHHVSFALSALGPVVRVASAFKPDIVMTVAPSLVAAPTALLAAKISGAKSWLHIQDFEVEAAFATGLVDSTGLIARMARRFEHLLLRKFDRVSSISLEMRLKAEAKIGQGAKVLELRNWARIDEIEPLKRPSIYRQLWGISTPHVALYSGNIANKQGMEIVIEVAHRLRHRTDLTFVICGRGPNRKNLETLAAGLSNIQFHDLQPVEQLNELLGMATLHLLPQKADAADLVLPSKLTNMLASGRPVIATTLRGTGLARELERGGVVTPPGDAGALSDAIVRLIDDPELHEELSRQARAQAKEAWDKQAIIAALERHIVDLTN